MGPAIPQVSELLMISSFKFCSPWGQNYVQMPYPSAGFDGQVFVMGKISDLQASLSTH